MNERDLLDKIFNDSLINYCDLCQCFYTTCEYCKNISCSGGGCERCSTGGFLEGKKHRVLNYLSESEKILFWKFDRLRDIMKESLNRGETEINWQKAWDLGSLSYNNENIYFKEELKNIDKTKKF